MTYVPTLAEQEAQAEAVRALILAKIREALEREEAERREQQEK
jgi:hypothetical protein